MARFSCRFSRSQVAALSLAAVATIAASSSPVDAAELDAKSTEAVAAYKLLAERCYGCHGGTSEKVPGFKILDRETLLLDRGEDRDPYLLAGDPDHSELFSRATDESMPPEASGLPQLTEEEIQLLRSWIENGAEFPRADREERQFVSESDILVAIADHNRRQNINDRPFFRYFSFAHLHNNRSITDRDLRYFKAALSKAINSMSRARSIVVPEAVDPSTERCYVDRRDGQETIFTIDLRDVGWDDLDAWGDVIEAYPYGLKPNSQDRDAVNAYGDLQRDFGAFFDEIPYIRADWFVGTATRPPLYHELADIPSTLDELLDEFGIDLTDAFLDKELARAGMFESGVSGQNRMVEVHDTSVGDFWLSYDFDKDQGKGNLSRFPLGPPSDDDRMKDFQPFAFEHAGGELIWNLPNGLHAYMLIETTGQRIDKGPVSIVWDSNETSGTPEVVNGVSCMFCHKHGMIDFEDEIRDGHALRAIGSASEMIDELYIPQSEMQARLDRTRQDYLRSLERAVGPFLQVGDDAATPIQKFPEPVNQLTRYYDRPLDLEAAACELGFAEVDELRANLNTKTLVQLGLEPLRKDPSKGPIRKRLAGKIKRSYWHSVEGNVSIFQKAAVELQRGSPVNP